MSRADLIQWAMYGWMACAIIVIGAALLWGILILLAWLFDITEYDDDWYWDDEPWVPPDLRHHPAAWWPDEEDPA